MTDQLILTTAQRDHAYKALENSIDGVTQEITAHKAMWCDTPIPSRLAQRQRLELLERDHKDAIEMLQSLPMVSGEPVSREKLLGCIGRAWCHQDNAHKVLDEAVSFAVCKEIEAINLYTSSQPPQPKDDGSDWFYKLQFICRVLEGNPHEQDKATALGMARSLKRERWTDEKVLQPITADDVTDEMIEIMSEYRGYVPTDTLIIAAAYNAVTKHRGVV